jgi:hypothetical protein
MRTVSCADTGDAAPNKLRPTTAIANRIVFCISILPEAEKQAFARADDLIIPIAAHKSSGRPSATPSINNYSRTCIDSGFSSAIAPQQAGLCLIVMFSSRSPCASARHRGAIADYFFTEFFLPGFFLPGVFVPDSLFQRVAMRGALDGHDARHQDNVHLMVDAGTCSG